MCIRIRSFFTTENFKATIVYKGMRENFLYDIFMVSMWDHTQQTPGMLDYLTRTVFKS